MRLWVRSEYAPALAALCAWLAALAPWTVTLTERMTVLGHGGRLLYVRFALAEVQYNFGLPLIDAVAVESVYAAGRHHAGTAQETAHLLWIAGAVLVTVAFLLGVATYLDPEEVGAYADPVRAIGATLVLAGGAYAVATYELLTTGVSGIPMPVGVVLQLVLGGLLLAVERRDLYDSPA
jgi:hypothetical protein